MSKAVKALFLFFLVSEAAKLQKNKLTLGTAELTGASATVTLTGNLAVTGTGTISGNVYPGSAGQNTQVMSTNGAGTLSWATVPPPGSVLSFAGTSMPVGYFLCDGSAKSRTTYSALFAVIGTTFGSGDGSTTFNVPDARSRQTVGVGVIGALGATGGASTATLAVGNLPAHTHAITDPGHKHWMSGAPRDDNNFSGGGTNGQMYGTVADASSYSADDPNYSYGRNVKSSTTGITGTQSTGSGTSFSIRDPYIALNMIIKY